MRTNIEQKAEWEPQVGEIVYVDVDDDDYNLHIHKFCEVTYVDNTDSNSEYKYRVDRLEFYLKKGEIIKKDVDFTFVNL